VFWWSHLSAIEAEGITTKAYAEREGLSPQALYQWRKRLVAGGRRSRAKLGGFVPIQIEPSMAVRVGCTVVIDAGHGGKDPGARGSSINEKAINLAVALRLGSLISENHNDVKVIYTRKTDVFIELDERANIANRNKADLFISIHTNAVKRGSSVSGTETYTLGLARTDENLEVAMRENSAILLEDNYLQKYEGFDPTSSESYIIFEFMQNKHMEQSISLASEIQKSFGACKRVDRGVRQAGFLVLSQVDDPKNYSTYFLKIDNVKFRQKVVPGDTLVMKVVFLTDVRRGIANIKGYAFVQGKIATEAEMTAQMAKNK
jgi:N-acetylmuramoyl-L-alanine amidase